MRQAAWRLSARLPADNEFSLGGGATQHRRLGAALARSG
jgi:hypothetical protein